MKKVMKNGLKRVCALVLTAAVTLTMFPVNAQAEDEKKELYTNGFEDGQYQGITARGNGEVKIEISNSVHHNAGSNSLSVSGRSATWHGIQLSLAEIVSSGNTYDFKAYVMQNTGSEQKIDMSIQYKDANGDDQYPSIVGYGKACASGEWTELSGSFTVPEVATGIALYLQCPDSGTMDFFVDDLSISGVSAGAGFQPEQELYNKMVKESIFSTGNNARIKAALQKARAGKDISLAYIGGSITEGGGYNPNSACYAEVSATAFAKKYGKDGGANVHFINAGMSGTSSDIGIIRYKRDVVDRLPEGSSYPDILFIEFAVNDSGCETGGGAYEGLIRQALKSGSAVVLVFSVFNNLNRVEEMNYRKYGTKYDLPMISTADAIKDVYQEPGFYKWFYNDSLHPNANGYKLMADCILELMDRVDKEEAETDNALDVDSMEAVTSSSYEGIQMIDATTTSDADSAISAIDKGGFSGNDSAVPTFQYKYNGVEDAKWFPNNWMHDGDGTNDPLTIEVNCQTFMLLYKETSENAYGSADLYVDGVKKTKLSCYNDSGWNNGKVCIALKENTSDKHTIQLKMAEGDEAKKFTLYAIGYQTDDTAADPAVENVKRLIRAIGEVSYDDASKGKIDAAKEAYGKLTDAQRALVDNYKALTDAEEIYVSLKPSTPPTPPTTPAATSITEAAVKQIEDQYYTGKALKPSLTITYKGNSLKAGVDYEVSYSGNTKIGTAAVTIKGKGNYTGEVRKTFKITVRKNAAYTVGSYKYKITDAKTNGKGTVALTGVKNKKGKSIKVVESINIGGKKFLITSIGNSAFSGCSKAASATIGKNVTKIGSKAFNNCKNLKKITIKGTKLNSVGSKAFKGINKKASIKVPKSKLKAYQKLLKGKGQASGVKIKK